MTIAKNIKISIPQAWLMAIRPKTLTLSIIPIVVGTTLASASVSSINWILVFFACFTAVFIQMGCNVVNDALDFKKGTDTKDRLGFTRVTQAGLLTYESVLRGGLLCFAIGFLTGIPLIINSGWPMGMALILSILFGYLYTGGPFPLAYYGLGELFVLLFFGFVITGSAFYVQTGFINKALIIASTQIGLLAIVPIAINNARDIYTDKKSNKRTLATTFGLTFARWEITILNLFAFVVGFEWIKEGYPLMAILPLCVLPLVFYYVKGIWATAPSKEYNRYFVLSPLSQLIFSILLLLGFFLT